MSPALKFLIGLAAVVALGWIHHGLLGTGDAFIEGMEAQARAAVAETEIPGISIAMGRAPLSRTATLSGPANPFQREGQGSLKGINDLVREVPGVANVRWTDEGGGGRTMPLFLEVLGMLAAAYLLGLGLAWLLWGRPKRQGFY